jgi:hypothetical protein
MNQSMHAACINVNVTQSVLWNGGGGKSSSITGSTATSKRRDVQVSFSKQKAALVAIIKISALLYSS